MDRVWYVDGNVDIDARASSEGSLGDDFAPEVKTGADVSRARVTSLVAIEWTVLVRTTV